MSTQTEQPQKSLREIAEEIAKALGQEWKRSTKFDEDDAQDRTQWRARLEGSGVEALFLSNTWGPKNMLHISGWLPDSVDHNLPRMLGFSQMASINISLSKTPLQMARDIERRLLPEYRKQLTEVLKAHVADLDRKEAIRKTKQRVAEIVGGLPKDDSEIVHGRGSVDIQVCGPDSLRFSGHCLYFNADQLERIRKAVPELFESQTGGAA